jgi:MinD-like ATPase involved in chromosome partitioning or flagellar assembly
MAGSGRRTLLVDAADRFGALHLLLDVEPPAAALAGRISDPAELLVPVAPSLTLLPTLLAGTEPRSAAERRLLLRRATTLHDDFDVVVVDAGATLDTMSAVCADGVSRFLIVTAADRIALVATYALIKALRARHPELELEVVANRLDEARGARGIEPVASATAHFLDYAVRYAGAVPDDPDFASALAAGLGAHEAAEGSVAVTALRAIGDRLLSDLAGATTPVAAPAPSTHPTRLPHRG